MCIFCCLTKNTYVRMLDDLKTLLPNVNPGVLLVGLRMLLKLPLGWHVLMLPGKDVYSTNMAIKTLAPLFFVPENDVLERILELMDLIPDLKWVDELRAYIEITYAQGRNRGHGRGRGPVRYPPLMWNHFENPANNVQRTTNAVEGHHSGLNILFLPQHPCMGKLLDDVTKDITLQQKVHAENLAANNLPSSQKYKVLSEGLLPKKAPIRPV